MPRAAFDQVRQQITGAMLAELRRQFEERSLPFDERAFLKEAEGKVDDIIGDAFFFGSETFPQ